jgi:hypothetical protein
MPHYQFRKFCRWSELPGGSLLITGGSYPAVREVVKIDTLREYAVCSQPPMHTARSHHAAVYHSQYLYVLGFWECERYSCAESRWEELPVLPVAGDFMSAVEVENCVYALGGQYRDTVQKLSLDSLTWELMQLKLPQAAECERYDTLHNHWQPIPPLPHASKDHAAIVCEYTRRIYTLGGRRASDLDLIQEFELESQTWK